MIAVIEPIHFLSMAQYRPRYASFSRFALLLSAFSLANCIVSAADVKNTTPIVSSDEAVQKELRDLEQRLDVEPKLEELLRQNIERLGDQEFRQNQPAIEVLLKQQPNLLPALKTERHFLIHRYLVKHARGPLLRPDIQAFDKFLKTHPDVRQALERNPAQIMKTEFLVAHPAVAKFFNEHPALSTVLLEKETSQSRR